MKLCDLGHLYPDLRHLSDVPFLPAKAAIRLKTGSGSRIVKPALLTDAVEKCPAANRLLLAGRHGLVGEHLARIAMPLRQSTRTPDLLRTSIALD
jgi:hypothetical protein